jgi:hypothetical protein
LRGFAILCSGACQDGYVGGGGRGRKKACFWIRGEDCSADRAQRRVLSRRADTSIGLDAAVRRWRLGLAYRRDDGASDNRQIVDGRKNTEPGVTYRQAGDGAPLLRLSRQRQAVSEHSAGNRKSRHAAEHQQAPTVPELARGPREACHVQRCIRHWSFAFPNRCGCRCHANRQLNVKLVMPEVT